MTDSIRLRNDLESWTCTLPARLRGRCGSGDRSCPGKRSRLFQHPARLAAISAKGVLSRSQHSIALGAQQDAPVGGKRAHVEELLAMTGGGRRRFAADDGLEIDSRDCGSSRVETPVPGRTGPGKNQHVVEQQAQAPLFQGAPVCAGSRSPGFARPGKQAAVLQDLSRRPAPAPEQVLRHASRGRVDDDAVSIIEAASLRRWLSCGQDRTGEGR